MLRLRTGRAEAEDILELAGGATVTVRAATLIEFHAAKAHADAVVGAIAEGEHALRLLGVDEPAILSDGKTLDGIHNWAFALELGASCVTAWTGIGDQDGEPLPRPTIETAKLLMADPTTGSRIVASAMRLVHEVLAEGEGSAVSPTGAREAASTTAAPAGTRESDAPSEDEPTTADDAPSARTLQ